MNNLENVLSYPNSVLIAAERQMGKTEQLTRAIWAECMFANVSGPKLMLVITPYLEQTKRLMDRLYDLLSETVESGVTKSVSPKLKIEFQNGDRIFFRSVKGETYPGYGLAPTHVFIDQSDLLTNEFKIALAGMISGSQPRIFETKTVTM